MGNNEVKNAELKPEGNNEVKNAELIKLFKKELLPLLDSVQENNNIPQELEVLKKCLAFSWVYKRINFTRNTEKSSADKEFREKSSAADKRVKEVTTRKGEELANSVFKEQYCKNCKSIIENVNEIITPIIKSRTRFWVNLLIGVGGSVIAAIVIALMPKLVILINEEGTVKALKNKGYDVEKPLDSINDTNSKTLSYFDAKSYNEKIAVSFGENDD